MVRSIRERGATQSAILLIGAALVAGLLGAAGAYLATRDSAGPGSADTAEMRAGIDRLTQRVAGLDESLATHRRTIQGQELALSHLGDTIYEQDREIEALQGLFQDLAAGVTPRAVASNAPAEQGVTDPGPSPYGTPSASSAAASGQVAGAATPYATATTAQVPPAMLEAARLALTEQREQERIEKEQQDLVQRMQRAERQVSRLTERLVLNEPQQQGFSTLLFERDEAQREAWRKVRSGDMDREEARAYSDEAAQTYEQALQQLLSPAQYGELLAHRAEREEESNRRRNSTTSDR